MDKSEDKITICKFNVIKKLIFTVINWRRPVNLFIKHFLILRHCRTCSGNLVGTSIFLRIFAVILGRDAQSVPRILLQQGTNLVNKLALLLHKCRFAQDTRDKPENDGCWKQLLAVCCNFVNTPHSALSCHSLPQGARECGRSMIEMLGVLAIIAVLSVGGIAGYSKTMRAWRSSQQKNMLAELIASAIKIKPNLNSKSQSLDDITYVLNAMGDLPEGTTYQDNRIYDKDGNYMTIKYGLQVINYKDGHTDKDFIYVVQFWFTANGKSLTPSAEDYCQNLINVAQNVADEIKFILLVQTNSKVEIGATSETVFNKSNLKTATLNEINQKCNISLKEGGNARFTLYLEPY